MLIEIPQSADEDVSFVQERAVQELLEVCFRTDDIPPLNLPVFWRTGQSDVGDVNRVDAPNESGSRSDRRKSLLGVSIP